MDVVTDAHKHRVAKSPDHHGPTVVVDPVLFGNVFQYPNVCPGVGEKVTSSWKIFPISLRVFRSLTVDIRWTATASLDVQLYPFRIILESCIWWCEMLSRKLRFTWCVKPSRLYGYTSKSTAHLRLHTLQKTNNAHKAVTATKGPHQGGYYANESTYECCFPSSQRFKRHRTWTVSHLYTLLLQFETSKWANIRVKFEGSYVRMIT